MNTPNQKIQTQNCCNLAATKREREKEKQKTNTEYLEVKKKKKKRGFCHCDPNT
jgi:hypothetical protein